MVPVRNRAFPRPVSPLLDILHGNLTHVPAAFLHPIPVNKLLLCRTASPKDCLVIGDSIRQVKKIQFFRINSYRGKPYILFQHISTTSGLMQYNVRNLFLYYELRYPSKRKRKNFILSTYEKQQDTLSIYRALIYAV